MKYPFLNKSMSGETTENNHFIEYDILKDFPILKQKIRGKQLVYLDNGATSQKPLQVIDTIENYYRRTNANIHRGVHRLSEQATFAYEGARVKVQNFFHAKHASEIVFVRGATEAINLVAQTYGRTHIHSGDEIILTEMEHHSNIVPWQILCEQTGAKLRVVPINPQGELELDAYENLLNSKTKIVAVTHLSNALGTINPIAHLIKKAHQVGVPVLIDGAQSASHMGINVQELDCDFYVMSGHKMYAPTGIGVLYAKKELLEGMPPYQGGGDMIISVSFEKSEYSEVPYKFEAGTPNIAGAIGLGAAIDYISSIGIDFIEQHEKQVLDYATDALSDIPGLKIIGTARQKAGILSFVMDQIHPHDIGTILDQHGVAVRAGHHCAMPVMTRFGIAATTRASLALYNSEADIDVLYNALLKVKEVFK